MLFSGEIISFTEIKSFKDLTGDELELKRDYKLLRRISINAVNKINELRNANA